MSNVEELARIIQKGGCAEGSEHFYVDDAADAVLTAGWRKKPSREAVYGTIISVAANGGSPANIADAILALMDGGSDDNSDA